MSRAADLRLPVRLVLLLAAFAAAGCAPRLGPPRPATVSELHAVYAAPPAVVRAAVLDALRERGHASATTEEAGDEGRALILVQLAPETRLALGIEPFGEGHTRLESALVYYGWAPEAVHHDLHFRVAAAIRESGGGRAAVMPIATYPAGAPPCVSLDSLRRTLAEPVPAEPPAGDHVLPDEEPPELIGGLESLRPDYPEAARRRGIEGRVVTRFVVERDGAVSCVEAVTGPRELAPAALEAAATARFRPARRDGEPVRVQFYLPITFQLR